MLDFLIRSPMSGAARSLYAAIVAAAREPVLYRDAGVPDTLDGRFEMICLHAHLVMRRLGREGRDGRRLSQRLFDLMFRDLEFDLREAGASDMKVGDRVKEMARGFYGRVTAYDAGLEGDDALLAEGLRRNLYGTVAPTDAELAVAAAYLRRTASHVDGLAFADLAAGRVAFAP